MKYEPAEFWDSRCLAFGHTGLADNILFRYNHPLRLKVIRRALSSLGINLAGRNVLDVGCGVGYFLEEFIKQGARVTGIDVSPEAVKKAGERLGPYGREVRLAVQKVEETDFPVGCFDLVSSIAVCQHIVDDDLFYRAVKRLARVAKPGGHILFMERAPVRTSRRRLSEYLMNRPRPEQVAAFAGEGCRLVYEKNVPFWGMALLEKWERVFRFGLGALSHFCPARVEKARRALRYRSGRENPLLYRLFRLGEQAVLLAAFPLDHWLGLTSPSRRAEVCCLIFLKEEEADGMEAVPFRP